MAEWRPSANCLLTLKQLGFTLSQIDRALIAYREVCGDPDDKGFSRTLKLAPDISNEQHLKLTAAAQIPLTWKASTTTEKALVQLGFSEEAITHYRMMFVIQTRESDIVIHYPDAAFREYCRYRPRALLAPLPADWLPAVSTIKEIAESTGRDWSDITDQLARFIDLHQESMSPDWNERFFTWMMERNGNRSISRKGNGERPGVTTG